MTIQPGESDKHYSGTNNIIFTDSESGEALAIFIEENSPPIPDEGDFVEVESGSAESEPGYDGTTVDVNQKYEGVVESISYRYALIEYKENDDDVEQLFSLVDVELAVERASKIDEDS